MNQLNARNDTGKQLPISYIQKAEKYPCAGQTDHTMRSSVAQVVIAGAVTALDQCMDYQRDGRHVPPEVGSILSSTVNLQATFARSDVSFKG